MNWKNYQKNNISKLKKNEFMKNNRIKIEFEKIKKGVN